MGKVWHVPKTGGPEGLEPGFYCEDEAALDALLADPTVDHAVVDAGAPSPLVHGQRARVATAEQAALLRALPLRQSISEPLVTPEPSVARKLMPGPYRIPRAVNRAVRRRSARRSL